MTGFGLEPINPEEEPADIFSVAAMLIGPRVVLTQGEDLVLAAGLDSLEIGDAHALGRALSAACGNEVVAIAPTGDGIHVAFFDGGDLDEDVAVALNPSGKTSSAKLSDIAPTEEAAETLRNGLSVMNAVELAEHVMQDPGGHGPPQCPSGKFPAWRAALVANAHALRRRRADRVSVPPRK